jgi:hypothetical protein
MLNHRHRAVWGSAVVALMAAVAAIVVFAAGGDAGSARAGQADPAPVVTDSPTGPEMLPPLYPEDGTVLPQAGKPMTDSELATAARKIAASYGDPEPTAIEVVHGAHADAVEALSPGVTSGTLGDAEQAATPQAFDERPVAAFVMHGKFVAVDRPRPSDDAPVPTGSVLAVVLDASTGELLDLYLTDAALKLAALGPVEAIE